MSTEATVVVAAVAAFLIGVLWVLSLFYRSYLRHHRDRYESERFKREPRVGDKAGYRLNGVQWRVGVVRSVNSGPHPFDSDAPVVELETEYVSYNGASKILYWWPVTRLRWFPPDTPLGIKVVKDSEQESVDGR